MPLVFGAVFSANSALLTVHWAGRISTPMPVTLSEQVAAMLFDVLSTQTPCEIASRKGCTNNGNER